MMGFWGGFFLSFSFFLWNCSLGVTLPPPDDIPEEVLATEIITEVRSPLNNEELTTEEYTMLKTEQAESKYPPQLSSKVRHAVFLLRLLNLMGKVLPF